MVTQSELLNLQSLIIPHILKAGEIILEYSHGDIEVSKKPDGSIVTPADGAAEGFIIKALREISNFPIVGEESVSNGTADRLDSVNTFWLIDALDGTRSFARGEDQYTVNVALITEGKPALGLIYAPAYDELFYASHGNGAFKATSCDLNTREKLQISPYLQDDPVRLVTGAKSGLSSKIEAFFAQTDMTLESISSHSSSYKFCLLAMDQVDIYPRLANISEWDIAAGHAILNEAGGQVIDLSANKSIQYGGETSGFLLHGFLASKKGLNIKKQ